MKIMYECKCGKSHDNFKSYGKCCKNWHILKKWRKENKMNQTEFSELLGKKCDSYVSRATVCNWETAKWFPTREMLDNIYKVTKIDSVKMYVSYRILNPGLA